MLMVATYRSVPRLLDAELSFAGIACAYHTAHDIEIADNYLVVFKKTAHAPLRVAMHRVEAALEFRLRNRARIALATFISDSPPPREALVLASPGMAAAQLSPILQGDTVDVYPGTEPRASICWAICGTSDPTPGGSMPRSRPARGLLVAGAVMIGWPARPAPRFAAARQGAATVIAAFALSASYAVLCPPFQVADEPSHFLTLTGYLGRPALGEQAKQWARRNRFRGDPILPVSHILGARPRRDGTAVVRNRRPAARPLRSRPGRCGVPSRPSSAAWTCRGSFSP